MGKCLSYRVFYQFIWIFGVISACFESACFKPVELMCDSEEVCNNGDCYRTTDSLIIDPKMGRSNQDCPKGFDNYKGYCLRVDLTRKKWHDAYKDSDNGELATFYRSQDDEISEEYLRMKLPDSKFGIWTSGKREQGTYYSLWFPSGLPIEDPYGKIIYERPHQPEHRSNSCLAILPNNYTNGQFIDCETEYNSLRIAYFTTGNIYMCQCYPGYSGVTCDSKASGHSVRNETIDPHGLECPQNTSISIEFADYKYRAGSFSYYTPTCAAPNTLSLLRYLCQGKNTCRLEPVLLKSYLSFPCYNINSTLTIQHSCLPNNETSCPSGTVQIDDEKSTNCAFVTQQRMSWNETMKFCQTHGGQLASFNNTSDLVRCSSYTGVTKSTTSFWIFGKLSDTIRPENNTAVECMKAIIDNQTNPINVKLTSDCSRNLTGICVFPPFHQNDTTKLSTLLQLTVKNAKGATVQNCSAQYYGGLTWPATIHGVTVDQPCPTGQNGYATWTCEENGEFNSLGPDFSYCTTSVSKDVAELSNNLDKGIHPDVVVTDLAVILETAETIASGDIVNAVYLLGKALIVQQQVMENMTNEEKEETMNTFTFGIVNTTGVVLNVDHLTPWFGLNLIERASIATKLLLEVEETGILYASVFTTATQILFEYNKTIQLFIETRNNTNHSELKMANIIIPSEAFSLASNPESGIIPIVATTYSTIGQVMPIGDHFLNLTNVTQVIGASLNEQIEMHDDKVIVTIEKPIGASIQNQSQCVFWEVIYSQWSTDGCELGDETNDTHFVCKCNHMTSFAVLMSFNPEKVNILALNVISIIGCCISIICLAACIIAFAIVRTLRDFSNQVHLQLCISLMIADILLITAHFYKTYQTENDMCCTALAMLLHYFYLATFMWMCLEGVQVYLKVVRFIDTRKQRAYIYFLIGYGIPGLVVGISAGVKIEGYGTAQHCFLDTKSGLIWGFIAFVLATLIFNAVLLFLSLRFANRNLHTGPMKRADVADSAKWMLRRIMVIHPLLGLTWLFGFLQFGDQLVFSYIFTIVSSLQGMFMLIFTAFDNKRIRQYLIQKFGYCVANDEKSPYSSQYQSSSSIGSGEESKRQSLELNRRSLLKKDISMETLRTEHTEAASRKLLTLDDATGVNRNSSY